MFNDKYGLTDAVLQGRKTMTRRLVGNRMTEDDIRAYLKGYTELANKCAQYKIGEVVAVAQPYKDIATTDHFLESCLDNWCGFDYKDAGWSNKMFVRADLMPHQIRITDIKIERLQDISDEDCMREGIYRWKDMKDCPKSLNEFQRNRFGYYGVWDAFSTPRKAFADLIDNPGVGGKGTWARNDWQFAYTFKLIK